MRLLWLCNMVPGAVQEEISGKSVSGLWVDHVLSDLRRRDITIRILCPGSGVSGSLDENCTYETFSEGLPYVYLPELEKSFGDTLAEFCPNVIHVWGTEYGHTLAMVNAAEQAGLLDRLAVSIQGLCSVAARHYAEGIPYNVQKGLTFRDFVRQDNILAQQKKFVRRGRLETEALRKVRHVIGRTDWDLACTAQIATAAQYHFCNETLREPFYQGQWGYDFCQKHRIFASSCVYPVKGFHYLIEAFAEVLKTYPDAVLAVTGKSFLTADPVRRSNYQKYLANLARKYKIEEKVEFLGRLSAEEMKAEYLKANAFVLPSTIENSPNSLGEAMLLGVPCVAADVGGVKTMLTHGEEGLVYQSTAPYMLAHNINALFADRAFAENLGRQARKHAQETHNSEKNLQNLLEIYHKFQ